MNSFKLESQNFQKRADLLSDDYASLETESLKQVKELLHSKRHSAELEDINNRLRQENTFLDTRYRDTYQAFRNLREENAALKTHAGICLVIMWFMLMFVAWFNKCNHVDTAPTPKKERNINDAW